jgi:hypothetical protein
MSRRTLVIAARTVLVMLLVAAAVLLGLGVVALVRADPAQADGWLRAVFGRVFGVAAVGLAAVLGVPSGLGLWAMAGAREPDAVPALPALTRQALAGVAIVATGITALVVLTRGISALVLDLGLIALVALATLGLAGAVAFSPHRGRAMASALMLGAVVIGTLWVLAQTGGVAAG